MHYSYTCTHTYINIHTYTYTQTHTYTHIHMYTSTHKHTYAYIHVHTHRYTDRQTHTASYMFCYTVKTEAMHICDVIQLGYCHDIATYLYNHQFSFMQLRLIITHTQSTR